MRPSTRPPARANPPRAPRASTRLQTGQHQIKSFSERPRKVKRRWAIDQPPADSPDIHRGEDLGRDPRIDGRAELTPLLAVLNHGGRDGTDVQKDLGRRQALEH